MGWCTYIRVGRKYSIDAIGCGKEVEHGDSVIGDTMLVEDFDGSTCRPSAICGAHIPTRSESTRRDAHALMHRAAVRHTEDRIQKEHIHALNVLWHACVNKLADGKRGMRSDHCRQGDDKPRTAVRKVTNARCNMRQRARR